MSYILAALKKADQEHFLGSVPDLATPQEVQPDERRSYRWHWLIGALLIVNVVLIVMLLKDRNTEVIAVPVAEQAQVTPEPQTPAVNEPLVQPVQPAIEPRVSEAPTAVDASSPAIEPEYPRGEVVVLPEPAQLQNSGSAVLPDAAVDMQLSGMTPEKDDPQLQSWFDLPQEFRNKIDLPRLDVHVYSDDPQGRFILVNLKKYREGETLPNGMVLEEILPDGMVMSYQSERFRVQK